MEFVTLKVAQRLAQQIKDKQDDCAHSLANCIEFGEDPMLNKFYRDSYKKEMGELARLKYLLGELNDFTVEELSKEILSQPVEPTPTPQAQ